MGLKKENLIVGSLIIAMLFVVSNYFIPSIMVFQDDKTQNDIKNYQYAAAIGNCILQAAFIFMIIRAMS